VFHYKANRRAATHLVTRLIEEGFEVAYAYEPSREAMPHTILNTLLFLDWDRCGFDYPNVIRDGRTGSPQATGGAVRRVLAQERQQGLRRLPALERRSSITPSPLAEEGWDGGEARSTPL
jgi:hypothetical protein